jgi:uncharacterized coiled-coil DUF342 family protein
MTEKVRKSDLLVGDVLDTKSKLRTCQIKYGEQVSELAMLTKSELVPTIKSLTNGKSIDEIRKIFEEAYDKIESSLYDLSDIQTQIDELIQFIEGWDLNNKSYDKILDILENQTDLSNNLRKDLDMIRVEMNEAYEADHPYSAFKDINDNLEDYLVNFSRLQDYLQEAVPRFDQLFNNVDEELKNSKKYSYKRVI